jgi:hypothetical protein
LLSARVKASHAPAATLIATMLVENYGCDVNPSDLNGSPSIAASPSSPTLAGMTPLHCASLAGNLSFVQSATTALVDEVFSIASPHCTGR